MTDHDARFHCVPFTMDLTVSFCAQRFKSKRFLTCQACPVGAEHAGDVALDLSTTCSRCQRVAPRLIHKKLCVSCYNREREMARGKDRRGKPPRLAIELAEVLFCNGEAVSRLQVKATTFTEVLIDSLRDQHLVSITRYGFCPGVQVELFSDSACL